MANFTTHIGVGTIVSGTLATLTLAADVIAPENLIAVTLAGVLGSVLPDIDLKDSRPSRAMWSGLAVFFSFLVLFNVAYRYSVAEMWILWLGTFLLIRYGGEAVFHRFSYHRGIFHSVLAGLMFWFLTAVVFKYALARHEGVAWLAGGFLFVGYLTHLLLDEIYSVDVMDRRLKNSFGTAMKFLDSKHPGQSAAIGALAVLFLVFAPSAKPFVAGLSSTQMWSELRQKLVPQERWFEGLLQPAAIQAARSSDGSEGLANSNSDLTTGSLRVPAGTEAPQATTAPKAE